MEDILRTLKKVNQGEWGRMDESQQLLIYRLMHFKNTASIRITMLHVLCVSRYMWLWCSIKS